MSSPDFFEDESHFDGEAVKTELDACDSYQSELSAVNSVQSKFENAKSAPPVLSNLDEKNKLIKRPLNAFMIWSKKRRREILENNPTLHNSEVSKMLGAEWREMSDESKSPFWDEAHKLMKQHKIDHPHYLYRPRRQNKTNKRGGKRNRYVSPESSSTISPPVERKRKFQRSYEEEKLRHETLLKEIMKEYKPSSASFMHSRSYSPSDNYSYYKQSNEKHFDEETLNWKTNFSKDMNFNINNSKMDSRLATIIANNEETLAKTSLARYQSLKTKEYTYPRKYDQRIVEDLRSKKIHQRHSPEEMFSKDLQNSLLEYPKSFPKLERISMDNTIRAGSDYQTSFVSLSKSSESAFHKPTPKSSESTFPKPTSAEDALKERKRKLDYFLQVDEPEEESLFNSNRSRIANANRVANAYCYDNRKASVTPTPLYDGREILQSHTAASLAEYKRSSYEEKSRFITADVIGKYLSGDMYKKENRNDETMAMEAYPTVYTADDELGDLISPLSRGNVSEFFENVK